MKSSNFWVNIKVYLEHGLWVARLLELPDFRESTHTGD